MARIILWFLLVQLTHGYKRGAPLNTCDDMTPQHHTEPQDSPSPFSVTISATEVRPGQSLTVTLVSPPGRNFKGFFVQARAPEIGVIGTFHENDDTQTIDCFEKMNSAATHKDNNEKMNLKIQWTAPNNFKGYLKFRATFVETGKQFWVNVDSPQTLTVAGEPIGAPQPLEEEAFPFQWAYDGCFEKKGCFGGPDGCVQKRRCFQLVTYTRNGSKFDIELIGDTKGWTAVGYSMDTFMGSDAVTACSLNGSNTIVSIFQSWNIAGPRKGNEVLPNMREGLSNLYGTYEDGFIYCRFTQDPIQIINEELEFNFDNGSYYLFLARGTMDSVKPPVKLNIHNKAPYISGAAASLSDVTELGMASNALIKLHGCLMTIAWIGTVSLAIFIARYFKQTWTNIVHLKQKVWFTWHRFLNIVTVLLTIVGFIVIFVQLQGWSQVWKVNPHPILGVITTALAVLQPIMAAFRCHPGTPKRPIFNWLHFLVGNSAHILAVITLFFAKPLNKANLPDFYMWILIAFVAFHVIVFFTMEAFTCFTGKEIRGNQIAMKDMAANGNAYHMNEQDTDAPGSRFRKFMLILYLFGNVCFVTAIVATISVSPVKDR